MGEKILYYLLYYKIECVLSPFISLREVEPKLS